MQIYYELPQQDVKSLTLGPSYQRPDRVIKDNPVLLGEDEQTGFFRVKAFLEKTFATLEAVDVKIEEIRALGIDYQRTKRNNNVLKVKEVVEAIQGLLDDSIYRLSDFDPDYSPLYSIWVVTGRNMDQRERFRLGTRRADGSDPEKMTVPGLKLNTLDITGPAADWLSPLAEAQAVIAGEKEKIRTYLERVDSFAAFDAVQRNMSHETFTMQSLFLFHNPRTLQKKLCQGIASLVDMQTGLLRQIRKLAEEGVVDNAKKDVTPALFRVKELVDELDRVASHASFNAMTLLQGTWASADTENPRAREIVFTTGAGKKNILTIPPIFAQTMLGKAFQTEGWRLKIEETLATEEGRRRAVTEIDASLKSLAALHTEVSKIDSLILAPSPFPEKILNDMVLEKVENLRKSHGLTAAVGYTPKTGLSVNTNASLFLIVLDNAYVRLLDLFYDLKTLVISNNRLFYSGEEFERMVSQAKTWLDKIEQTTADLQFNAKRYFEPRETAWEKSFSLVFDERGKWTGTLLVHPLTSVNLSLEELEDFINPFSFEQMDRANQFTGVFDVLSQKLALSRYRIHFLLVKALLGERWDAIREAFDKKKKSLPDAPSVPLREMGREIFSLEKSVIRQIAFYAWAAINSLYSSTDRLIMNEHIAHLAADADRLLRAFEELLEANEKEKKLGREEKVNITGLRKQAGAWRNSLLKLKSAQGLTVNDEREAERLFLLVTEIEAAIPVL